MAQGQLLRGTVAQGHSRSVVRTLDPYLRGPWFEYSAAISKLGQFCLNSICLNSICAVIAAWLNASQNASWTFILDNRGSNPLGNVLKPDKFFSPHFAQ